MTFFTVQYYTLSSVTLPVLLLPPCIISICCMCLSALQCPRLTVHKHLVASLLLFYSSLLVYLEPYVTQRKQGLDYRQYVSSLRCFTVNNADFLFCFINKCYESFLHQIKQKATFYILKVSRTILIFT